MAIELAGPDDDTGTTTHRSQGAWGACQRCHAAIEAGDWTGVERDLVSGRIASLLHPHAGIITAPLERL